MQTHPGIIHELRRASYARADAAEVPTVAFHWDQAQRIPGSGAVPDNQDRTVYRVRVQASTREAGLHNLGEVLTHGNLRGIPNRTLFIASLPGAISWAAEVTAISQGTGNNPEPATFGFSECPVCIDPGITPIGGTLETWDEDLGTLQLAQILAPGVTAIIGPTGNNRRFRRIFIKQPGLGASVEWFWLGAAATGGFPISLPAGGELELDTLDRLHHDTNAWDIELDNSGGTGNLYVYVELVP